MTISDPKSDSEGCLPFIAFLNPYLVIRICQIQLYGLFGTAEAVERLSNQSKVTEPFCLAIGMRVECCKESSTFNEAMWAFQEGGSASLSIPQWLHKDYVFA